MTQNKIATDGKAKVSINIPEKLLLDLDANRLEISQDRSVWIASAIMEKLASIKIYKEKNKQ